MWGKYLTAAIYTALFSTAIIAGVGKNNTVFAATAVPTAVWTALNPIVLLHVLSAIVTLGVDLNAPVLDCDNAFPGGSAMFEAHYSQLRNEAAEVPRILQPNTRDTYGGTNAYIGSHTTVDNQAWRVFTVYVAGIVSPNARTYTPKLAALAESHPEVLSTVISFLPPGAKIPLHTGYFKGVIRYMLALRVPKDAEQCFINVGGEKRTWVAGQSLCFDDTYEHYVENNTNETRVVVYADILRHNMPRYAQVIAKTAIWLIRNHPVVLAEISRSETIVF